MTGTLECDTLRSGVFYSFASYDSIKLNNCYHNTDFSLKQGTHTSATGNELKSLLGDGWVVSNEGLDFTVTLIPAADAPTLVECTATQTAAGNEWYLPDGRRIQGAPAAGTLYLQPGRKVIILP